MKGRVRVTAIRVIALCMASALFLIALRSQRPELAALFSLAVGAVVLMMLREPFTEIVAQFRNVLNSTMMDGQTASIVLKATGIAILSELGVQICIDSGESAMAGRIRLAARIVTLSMALPLIGQIAESLSSLLSFF